MTLLEAVTYLNTVLRAETERTRELSAKATKGPWGIKQCPCGSPHCNYHWPGPMSGVQGSGYRLQDALLISHARTALPSANEALWIAVEALMELAQFTQFNESNQSEVFTGGAVCAQRSLIRIAEQHAAASKPQ